MIENIFEKWSVAGVSLQKQAVLASVVLAKESSLVIDMGELTTECVPVWEGNEFDKGMIKVNYGGWNQTNELYSALNQRKQLQPCFLKNGNKQFLL